MDPLRTHDGIVVPLDRSDVDTDQIIPKQFLKKITKTGFGIHLFHDWRYLDNEGKEENPKFPLNQARYRGASILLTRDNFGCGSSREHAPWALLDFGIRVVIAPSFADIFFNNCFKNGILPVILGQAEIDRLFAYVEGNDRRQAYGRPGRPGGQGTGWQRGFLQRGRPVPQGMPDERLGRHRAQPAAGRTDSSL